MIPAKTNFTDWLAFPWGVGLDRLIWGILDHGVLLPDPRGRSIDVAHQQHVSDNEAISRGFQISASLMGYGR